jgi:hypothetical protein
MSRYLTLAGARLLRLNKGMMGGRYRWFDA